MKINKKIILFILVVFICAVVLWLFAYNKNEIPNIKMEEKKDYPTESLAQETLTQTPLVQANDKPINNINDNKKIMNAILHTNKGDITIQFNSETPNTVANFVKLAKEGFYDGTKFHRVIKGFMNQGGDPLTKDDSKKDFWGTGGPGYAFADEITPTNSNDENTIAMANSGPNTNGSQFFINAAANNFLDTKHTVFGKVTSGADIVSAINNVPTDGSDRPIEPVILQSITLK